MTVKKQFFIKIPGYLLGFTLCVFGFTAAFAQQAATNEEEQQKAAKITVGQTEYEYLLERISQEEQFSESEKAYFLELESRFESGRASEGQLDNQGGPDDFEYVFRDNVAPDDEPYEWIELRGDPEATWIGGLTHFTSIDDGYSRQKHPIGFPFPFYGVSYDSLCVATNGFLQFTTTATSLSNNCLPQTTVAGPMVAVFWDDLHLFRGGRADTIVVGYKNFGDYFVIQYDEIGFYTTNCPNIPLKFEAILYSNGDIKLQYHTITRPAATCQNSQTIGIQQAGTDSSSALNYVCNTTGFQPEDGLAILFARAPGIPLPCTNLTAVYNEPDVQLGWTDPATDTQGNPIIVENVEVWLGAADTGQLLATVGPGGQSYTHANAPIGNLFYTVRPYLTPFYGTAVSVPMQVGTPLYENDFETDNGLWMPIPESDGWGWGEPWGIADLVPHSGLNVWGTQLTGNYGNSVCWQLDFNESWAVISPAATIEFWYWNKSQLNYDGTNFKASVDNGATWTVLTPSQNPYNTALLNTANACLPGQPGWSGITPLIWRNVVIPVGEFLGQAPIFRFEFSSNSTTNSYPGFYLDDMTMWGVQPEAGIPQTCTDLIANEVDGDVVLTWRDPAQDTQGNEIAIEHVQIWNGQIETGTLLGTVAAGVETYTHVGAYTGTQVYSIRAYLAPFYGRATATSLVVGNPTYFDDFEVTDGSWISDNPNGWQCGSPQNGPGSAHSGANCWGTVLTGNYSANTCLHLTLDIPLAVVSPSAAVEFWAWYDSELAFDGCNLKVSNDGGTNWEIVDPVRPYDQASFSNTNTCQSGEPGWAGHAHGFWEYIVVPIGQYIGDTLQYRFTFGSDGSLQYAGFFFDDLKIWGLSDPVGAPVSGVVTLDGGTGMVAEVSVHADGLGNPETNPAANGAYSLSNVVVGDRIIWAELDGYHNAVTELTVPAGGMNNVNLTLVRLGPPVPTGLEGSIVNTTGVVSLHWDASTDPLVDSYNIYRRLQGEENYVHVDNVAATVFTHDLSTVGPGIHQYAVSAVDEDVSTPVESELTDPVTLLYGEMPPSGLVALGNYDDKIVLDWSAPGTPPEFEIYDDEGASENIESDFGRTNERVLSPADIATRALEESKLKAANSEVGVKSTNPNSAAALQDHSDLKAKKSTPVVAHSPISRVTKGRKQGNSLDTPSYIVYRRPTGTETFVDIGHPDAESFEDTGLAENVSYDYRVTAYYDDSGEESGPTPAVTMSCNMAPAAPTNVATVTAPPNGALVFWTDPSINADGTPLVDLAGVQIFRDSILVGTVGPGLGQYIDNPPVNGYYTWTLRAFDEVPNVSEASNSAGGIAGTPSYFSDFDSDDGGWASDNPNGWQCGAPTVGPASAHSGANCWATVLAANYPSNACFQLILNPEITIRQADARVEFWGWYDSELGFDGCNFRVSGDGGTTWEIVDPVRPYDQTSFATTNTCMPTERGWAGHGQGYWEYIVLPIGQYIGQELQYRFTFGSDGSLAYAGMFIDDLVIWGGGPSGEIAGQVRELGTNSAIEGAEITVLEIPDAIAFTDAEGRYSLSLEPGTYTVIVHKQGYCDIVSPNIVVLDNTTITCNFSMLQPAFAVSVTSINLLIHPDTINTAQFNLTNPGAGCPLEFAISSDVPWLTFDPVAGAVAPNASRTVTVTVNDSGLTVGQHQAVITIDHNDTNSPHTIPVVLEIPIDNACDSHPIPTEFAFFQNYPNPFNAATVLQFDLPVEAEVEIAVFNVMGQEVARPVNRSFFPAGHHKVLYSADGLPSGMYLVKMNAGSFSGLQKMVLLK